MRKAVFFSLFSLVFFLSCSHDGQSVKSAEGQPRAEFADSEPSCHCLTAEYTQNPVAHGEKGVVRLVYDGAENKKTTHFYRTAVVYSNASNNPVTLVVEGEVVIPTE